MSLAWCTQEDITLHVMMELGTSITPGDTAVVLDDIAASHPMVPAESRLSQYVANKIDCGVHVIGSCGLSSATPQGTLLAFHVRNDRGESWC